MNVVEIHAECGGARENELKLEKCRLYWVNVICTRPAQSKSVSCLFAWNVVLRLGKKLILTSCGNCQSRDCRSFARRHCQIEFSNISTCVGDLTLSGPHGENEMKEFFTKMESQVEQVWWRQSRSLAFSFLLRSFSNTSCCMYQRGNR